MRFTILHRLFPVLCLLLSISGVSAQIQERTEQPERRTLVAMRLNGDESINLDGRLEEPIWQRAIPATDWPAQRNICADHAAAIARESAKARGRGNGGQ